MAEAVYLLCAITSVICAFLFMRSYRTSRMPLILWTGICFAGFAVNNVMLFVDLALFPVTINLVTPRLAVGLVSVVALLYGMIASETARG
jgi:hypothetical protein